MAKIDQDKFKELLDAAKTRGKTATGKVAALSEIKEEIARARQAGFGYAHLAELIKRSGFSVSEDVVKRFCKQVLGEPTTKRKSRRKTRMEEEEVSSKPKSAASAPEAKLKPQGGKKSGFRVAGDDL